MDVELREYFYKTLAVLYRYAEQVAVLEYPKRMERRSIDLAVRFPDGKSLLVKITVDVESIPKSEVTELSSLATVLGVAPLIVAKKKAGVPLLEGVLYEKYGARVLNLETLENILSGKEDVYVYESRDSFRVSIDPEKLKERRMERGLSLGDLALILGVSRKAAYEYERGTVEPNIEKARRLIEALGEDIVKPLDVFKVPREPPTKAIRGYDSEVEARIAGELEAAGFRVAHAKRTVADISGSRRRERIVFVIKHPRESVQRVYEKSLYFEKFVEVIGADEHAVVTEDRRLKRNLEGEGIRVVKPDEIASLVRRRGEEE